MPQMPGARPSLRQGIDRDIRQIVLRLEEQQPSQRLTVSGVCDAIKRSNSSLARQKKRPLEESIERVLAHRSFELQSAASDDSNEALEAAEAAAAAAASSSNSRDTDGFLLNRQIAKSWNFSAPSGRTASPSAPTGKPAPSDSNTGDATHRLPNGEAKPKRRRAERREPDRSPPQGVSLHDLAGIDAAIDRLLDCIWMPLRQGRRYEQIGFRVQDGVLLHGPSGCGKTTLAHALAARLQVAYIPVSTPSLVGGTSGESEKNIRDVFAEAVALAPCLIFLDEIDAVAGKRDSAHKAMEGRMVAEIMAGMDRIARDTPLGKHVVVLAATSRPDSLDPVVRRRFGVEIDIGMPNQDARERILRALTRTLALADDVDFTALAKLTPGYVGADLRHVVNSAVSSTLRASIEHQVQLTDGLSSDGDRQTPGNSDVLRKWDAWEAVGEAGDDGDFRVTFDALKTAVSTVQPASKREGFSAIPDTTWAHVGALHQVRRKLEMAIIGPIQRPEWYAQVGIQPAAGILLWGPPGCGKTLVAKAVANASKANFICIKGPELLNKYVGESERAVRQLFARAKSSVPCILFFDEMDALASTRSRDGASEAATRVVNALLTELDGVGDRSGIYVVGATNRPDVIDPAIRRPGRLGTSIYVGLPTADDRVDILRTLYRNAIRTHPGGQAAAAAVDAVLEAVARDLRCNRFSGADLGSLMQAAAEASLERSYASGQPPVIAMEDWQVALREIKPSVGQEDEDNPLLAELVSLAKGGFARA